MTKIENELNRIETEEYLRYWFDIHKDEVISNKFRYTQLVVMAMRQSKKDLRYFFGLDWVAYDHEVAYKFVLDYVRYLMNSKKEQS